MLIFNIKNHRKRPCFLCELYFSVCLSYSVEYVFLWTCKNMGLIFKYIYILYYLVLLNLRQHYLSNKVLAEKYRQIRLINIRATLNIIGKRIPRQWLFSFHTSNTYDFSVLLKKFRLLIYTFNIMLLKLLVAAWNLPLTMNENYYKLLCRSKSMKELEVRL